ncbi:hypothetical protein, partial [Escherichia coli]|uniref:hypothetical protein n=3 Tax=Escherichia coli TaxID=562 RepID=UPI0037480889
MNWLRHTYQETLFPGRTYPPETPLLSGLKFFGIYRTQKNADITDRLLSVPNSADPKAMYLSTERVPDILGMKWFTEFGHLNRGDMLTSEQHRCHN